MFLTFIIIAAMAYKAELTVAIILPLIVYDTMLFVIFREVLRLSHCRKLAAGVPDEALKDVTR